MHQHEPRLPSFQMVFLLSEGPPVEFTLDAEGQDMGSPLLPMFLGSGARSLGLTFQPSRNALSVGCFWDTWLWGFPSWSTLFKDSFA